METVVIHDILITEKKDGCNYLGLKARKPVFWGLRTTKGADQPAHIHSLISTFVIRFLESIT